MGRYEVALRLMKNETPDPISARRSLEEAIEDGDPRAAYALATWLLHGAHGRKDMKRGVLLLQAAADGHVRDALFDLAVLHERGRGVARNKRRAFQLFEQAANSGDTQAMSEVGRMLYYGIGVAEDRGAAERWLTRSELEKSLSQPHSLEAVN